jgi:hypothetical protein
MRPILAATLVALAAAAAGCGDDASQSALPRGDEPVTLDPARFSATIDNPYWPMRVGSRWVYREVDEDGVARVTVTVTPRVRTVDGVEARVVRDVVTRGGRVVEDTFDWYAQDDDGNVWYLGEDTTAYEEDGSASTEGSWEAGVGGAQAGIAMPGHPAVGMEYRQEYLAGEAEDAARVLSLDEQAQVPYGHVTGALLTKDFTPVEPRVLEYKLYAPGVGPVLALGVSGGGGREELLSFDDGR